MSEAKVTVQIEDKVAVVTINNASSHNALSSEVIMGLIEVLGSLSGDSSVRAVILIGAGDKAFCAGLDLKELSSAENMDMGADGGIHSMGVESPMMMAFEQLKQPIIGAINGFAITGGFELALACDFLVCSDNARFADTHALVGLLPGWGLSQKLPRLIGINQARELSFTGRYVDAEEARGLGIVNHVFPADQLLAEARKLAAGMVNADPRALAEIKRVINQGAGMDFASAMRMEGETSQQYNNTVDLSHLQERLVVLRGLANSRK